MLAKEAEAEEDEGGGRSAWEYDYRVCGSRRGGASSPGAGGSVSVIRDARCVRWGVEVNIPRDP